MFPLKPKTKNTTMEQDAQTMTKISNTIVSVDSNPSFLSCNAPKTGCSAWYAFFLFVCTGRTLNVEDVKTNFGANIHSLAIKVPFKKKTQHPMGEVYYRRAGSSFCIS